MLTENASKIQQKYLGAKGLIVLIAVMNMFVPLSIDLFISAGTADDRYRICCDTFDGQFDAGQFFLLFRSGDSAVWAGK